MDTIDFTAYLRFSPFFSGEKGAADPTTKLFNESFNNLPDGIRDLLLDENVALILQKTAIQFHIATERVEPFIRSVRNVASGITPFQTWPTAIAALLNMPPEDAKKLCSEVFTRIFKPVLTDFRTLHPAAFGTAPPQENPAPATAPKFVQPPTPQQQPGQAEHPANTHQVVNLRELTNTPPSTNQGANMHANRDKIPQ